MSANVESMMYYGEVPWHGAGTRVDKALTAAEAIVAAGMDWRVDTVDVMTEDGLACPRSRAIVRRSATGGGDIVLGICGRVYTPVQNRDAFRFFDTVVGEGLAIYHTAGVIGRGERIWILAKIPGRLVIGGEDVVDKYIVLVNSHDCTMPLRFFFTPIRVVCENTLSAALGGFNSKVDRGVSLKHYPNIYQQVDRVKEMMGFVDAYYSELEGISNEMAMRQLTSSELDVFVHAVVPGESTRSSNNRNRIKELFEGDKNSLPGIRGSLWGAYNAVTEWVDWVRRIPGSDKDPSRRLNSVWFEGGAKVKMDAWDACEAILHGRMEELVSVSSK